MTTSKRPFMADISADLEAVNKTHRRVRLGHVMAAEATVSIYNPITGALWEDVTIIGLLDEPGMLIEDAEGIRRLVPQSFRIDNIRSKDGS